MIKDLNNYITLNKPLNEKGIKKFIAVKDNIVTKDLKTTCFSQMLNDFLPLYNAPLIESLINEGFIIVGKTKMKEFNIGEGVNACADVVSNGDVLASITTDIGGESLNSSLVALRPTYGLLCRDGLISCADSLEQIGIISRTIKDNAMLLQVVTGHDYSAFNFELKDKKIVILGDGYQENKVIKKLEAEGMEIKSLSFDGQKISLIQQIILAVETSSNLSKFDGIRYGYRSENFNDVLSLYKNTRSEGFGLEVKKMILLGTYLTKRENINIYYKALKLRQELVNTLNDIFEDCDYIFNTGNPLLASLTGHPIISVTGFQIMANYYKEENLYKLGYYLEQLGSDNNV